MAHEASAEKKGGVWETVKTVFWALVIAGLFRTLLFQPFYIPSASMKPTLLIGDFLFVNKMAYGYSRHSCPFSMCFFIDGRWLGSEPDRGDVIVFRHPVNGQDFIKRLIGLPGDRVQMRQGRLLINGEAVPHEPIGDFVETYDPGARGGPQRCHNGPVAEGAPCIKEAFLETLPGDDEPHVVLNIRDGQINFDDTAVFTVPEGHYFFMGDNRDNSTDSRIAQPNGVGFVPYENLIGRADRVIFSSAGQSLLFLWTWRLDRFFEDIP
ncbi:signal peptidase I [Hasllibacter halocynthiae]|uniref:Signal peptidase I n=1 Tax=Hasllibacter halocynthiae TaxID=595589 RepID=A0A2T0X3B2_9RHOB|nr:signal peptidase I [Hasllibacter halocynthiae]PRY93428.1 signal peptidase I [Hasllibacter halocynthiae]